MIIRDDPPTHVLTCADVHITHTHVACAEVLSITRAAVRTINIFMLSAVMR